ncbi:hypothetical protein NR798_21550 [Archangium gephyra]|uniref:hypothetical protein n=1 Tax=Archangium gephyra TaxID=48 RepID=UPI0035D45AE8
MRLNRKAVVAVALLAAGVAAASIGPYARARFGVRQTVCAQSLYLRTAPNDGPWSGTLVYGETFTSESRSGDYVYGFAYGQLNRKGWVQDGWFCN